jgi:hypothetical protein
MSHRWTWVAGGRRRYSFLFHARFLLSDQLVYSRAGRIGSHSMLSRVFRGASPGGTDEGWNSVCEVWPGATGGDED